MNTLITGGSGLVGKYLQELMPGAVYVSSRDYDLTNQKEASLLIRQEGPKRIIHLAAKVGGILDNQKLPCDYYEKNIQINTNLLSAARHYGVERFTGILSTCIYPDSVDSGQLTREMNNDGLYPLKEEMLHMGPPAASNFGYGIAKRALATHIDMCNAQYGTKYNYLIPCNMYGFYDNYDAQKSHYVASLIRKIYNAKDNEIEIFGTGKPLRQFMYAGDFALVIKQMIDRDIVDSFNVATEEVRSILDIAEIALDSLEKRIKIYLNPSYPDGQFRKDVDISKFREHFPDFKFTSLADGFKKTYDYYSKLQNEI